MSLIIFEIFEELKIFTLNCLVLHKSKDFIFLTVMIGLYRCDNAVAADVLAYVHIFVFFVHQNKRMRSSFKLNKNFLRF